MMEDEPVVDLGRKPRPPLDYIELMMNTFLLHKFRESLPAPGESLSRIFGDYASIDTMHRN